MTRAAHAAYAVADKGVVVGSVFLPESGAVIGVGFVEIVQIDVFEHAVVAVVQHDAALDSLPQLDVVSLSVVLPGAVHNNV